jgi:DNA-binding CsgD family transcriptional regulator
VKLRRVEGDRRSQERRAGASPHLTPRELQVLSLVLGGAGNKQIAGALGVSEQAIKEHVSSLLAKFSVPNRAALAEAGARLEFSGERGVDRSWMRGLFLDAQPQISIARGPELRFEAANEAFMEAVGRRPVIGRTVREAFPELEGQGVLETGERVYATGVPVIEHEVARQWDRGNGLETRLIDLVIQPLHDERGEVNGIVSFAVDVTELVAERTHTQIPNELGPVLELIPNAVVVVDADGRVVRMNEAARVLAIQVDRSDIPLARALRGQTVLLADTSCLIGDPPRAAKLQVSARPLIDAKGVIVGAIAVYG